MKTDLLACRHIGVNKADAEVMLRKIGVASLDELIDKTIPANIRLKAPLALPAPMTEYEFARHIAELAGKNKLFTTYIGMGWYNTITPAVIQRNVFENPVWYTSYTPYQTEVSQGRLEALMNFQTAVCDLTAMPLANCSLLDEATAAAEAVTMMYGLRSRNQQKAGATWCLSTKISSRRPWRSSPPVPSRKALKSVPESSGILNLQMTSLPASCNILMQTVMRKTTENLPKKHIQPTAR